ncbi:MAG TPA: CAP domain-containing protein [Candidatus Paceibacterota bacterium]
MLSKKAFLVCLVIFVVPFSARASSLTSSNVASEINRIRNEQHLHVFIPRQSLNRAAKAKADEIAVRGFLSHTEVIKNKPWGWLSSQDYQYSKAGEILAVNINSAEALVEAWMSSPSHRATLLSAEFTEVGIGISAGFYEGKESNFAAGFVTLPKSEVEQENHDVNEILKLIDLLKNLLANYQKLLSQINANR